MVYNRDESISLGLFVGETPEEAYDRAYSHYENDYHLDRYAVDITEIPLKEKN